MRPVQAASGGSHSANPIRDPGTGRSSPVTRHEPFWAVAFTPGPASEAQTGSTLPAFAGALPARPSATVEAMSRLAEHIARLRLRDEAGGIVGKQPAVAYLRISSNTHASNKSGMVAVAQLQ